LILFNDSEGIKQQKGEKMPRVEVTPIGKKFQVLVNGIRRGSEYSTQAIADSEANKIREHYNNLYTTSHRVV
jgi:hypothetical protein